MFVKICGITNREDAFAAVDAGAQALGFIFYPPSPRSVTVEHLEGWVSTLPAGVWKVGVFVDDEYFFHANGFVLLKVCGGFIRPQR